MTPTDNTDAPAGMAETRPDDAFWRTVVDDIRAGRFWNAEAKSQDGQPVERLEAAMAGLPRAGAFREAAIATRGIIRNRMKENRDRDRHLGLLYWLAAVDAHPTDEDERAALTGERLYSVSVDYDRLGHASLGLLNKTDRVWLTERWGEPAAPTTADAARGGGTARVATPAPAAPSPSTTSPAEKVSAAADHAGDAARETAEAIGETASAIKEKANAATDAAGETASTVKDKAGRASYETGRAAQRTRADLERAGRWIGRHLGNHHPAGSDERRFTDRQDLVLIVIGGLILLLLLLAIIF